LEGGIIWTDDIDVNLSQKLLIFHGVKVSADQEERGGLWNEKNSRKLQPQ